MLFVTSVPCSPFVQGLVCVFWESWEGKDRFVSEEGLLPSGLCCLCVPCLQVSIAFGGASAVLVGRLMLNLLETGTACNNQSCKAWFSNRLN